jgi:hypothetical protein
MALFEEDAERLLKKVIDEEVTPTGYLIRFSMEEHQSSSKLRGHAKSRYRRARKELLQQEEEEWRTALAAAEAGNIEVLRTAVDSAHSQQRIRWCETHAKAAAVIGEFYSLLRRSSRPFDAYDYGCFGSIVWLELWQD